MYNGTKVPFGTDILFEVQEGALKGLCVACEICEDLWVPNTPGTNHAMAGANLIVNLIIQQLFR